MKLSRHNRFAWISRGRLALLAIVMLGVWIISAPTQLTRDEQALWERVSSAHSHLVEWRKHQNLASPVEHDPWGCGLIGIEWSGITTTLGDLEAKRTACNPAWAIQFSRWFQDLGLQAGDPIAIYSSASFPGLLLNAIAAAEAIQLKPVLIVSLGASTWGANLPELPWPALAMELRSGGFISGKADYYTLGGGAELGHGLSEENIALLHAAATGAGVGVLTADGLDEMVRLKTALLAEHGARVLVSVGGSQANLGDDEDVLRLSRGLVPATEKNRAGNGVIAHAMQNDIPVIHMLNIRSIAGMAGIPYDSAPRQAAPVRVNMWWSGAGLLMFLVVLFTHKRWKMGAADL